MGLFCLVVSSVLGALLSAVSLPWGYLCSGVMLLSSIQGRISLLSAVSLPVGRGRLALVPLSFIQGRISVPGALGTSVLRFYASWTETACFVAFVIDTTYLCSVLCHCHCLWDICAQVLCQLDGDGFLWCFCHLYRDGYLCPMLCYGDICASWTETACFGAFVIDTGYQCCAITMGVPVPTGREQLALVLLSLIQGRVPVLGAMSLLRCFANDMETSVVCQ